MSKQMEYEESLDYMNETMLREECLRLHRELMVATKKLLTQPMLDGRACDEVQADLDRLIEEKRREFHEICRKDMSPVTTAELNKHREIQRLITRRKK